MMQKAVVPRGLPCVIEQLIPLATRPVEAPRVRAMRRGRARCEKNSGENRRHPDHDERDGSSYVGSGGGSPLDDYTTSARRAPAQASVLYGGLVGHRVPAT